MRQARGWAARPTAGQGSPSTARAGDWRSPRRAKTDDGAFHGGLCRNARCPGPPRRAGLAGAAGAWLRWCGWRLLTQAPRAAPAAIWADVLRPHPLQPRKLRRGWRRTCRISVPSSQRSCSLMMEPWICLKLLHPPCARRSRVPKNRRRPAPHAAALVPKTRHMQQITPDAALPYAATQVGCG